MWRPAVLLVNFAALLLNTDAVSFSSLCKLADSSCIKKTVQDFVPVFSAGIPELGVEQCDPLFLNNIDLSVPALKFKLKDVKMTGLKDAIVKSIKFDKTETSMSLRILSSLKIEGSYVMDGKILFIPIEGKGPAHADLSKIEIAATVDIKEKVGKDGKVHWYFVYKSHSFEPKDKSDLEFGNLFGGDALLANATRELIKNNGNEVIKEVGGTLVKAVIDNLIVGANKMLEKMSLDELRLL